MPGSFLHFIFRSALFLGLCASLSSALERTSGVNATLETQAGTRAAALGGTALAVPADLPALAQNPHQLASLHFSEISFAHVNYYEGTTYDYAAMGWPTGSLGGLGLAVSRFGASGIPLIREEDPLPEGDHYQTFSMSDWVITGAWGHRFHKLSLGLSAHALKRELDQSGWGFRADMGARLEVLPRLAAAALLKGWTSSAARWESGQTEYYPPELTLALHASEPFPFFYGTAHVYWQSAGFFHRENRDLEWDGDLFDTTTANVGASGKTLWQDPLDWIAGGSLGIEFSIAEKLDLRAGLQQMGNASSWTAGAGLRPVRWFQVHYAFQNHPVLSGVHRASITLYPGILLHPETLPQPSVATPPPAASVPSPPATADTMPLPPSEPSGVQEDGSSYWEE